MRALEGSRVDVQAPQGAENSGLQMAKLLRNVVRLGRIFSMTAGCACLFRNGRRRQTAQTDRLQGARLHGTATLAYRPRAVLAPCLHPPGHGVLGKRQAGVVRGHVAAGTTKCRHLLGFGGLLLCGRGLEEILRKEDLISNQTTTPAHLLVEPLRFLGACAKGTQRRLATSQKVQPLGACAGRLATDFLLTGVFVTAAYLAAASSPPQSECGPGPSVRYCEPGPGASSASEGSSAWAKLQQRGRRLPSTQQAWPRRG